MARIYDATTCIATDLAASMHNLMDDRFAYLFQRKISTLWASAKMQERFGIGASCFDL